MSILEGNDYLKKFEIKLNNDKYKLNEQDVATLYMPDVTVPLLGYSIDCKKNSEQILLLHPEHTYLLWHSNKIGSCLIYISNQISTLLCNVEKAIEHFEKIKSDNNNYFKVEEYKKILSGLGENITNAIPELAFLFNNYIIAFMKLYINETIDINTLKPKDILTEDNQIILFPQIRHFLDWLYYSLTNLLNTLEYCFNKSTNKSKTTLFSKSNIQLPNSILKTEYEGNKLKILGYSYHFQNIIELLDIVLYHINLNGKTIIKCKNCNKFFIPKNKNDEIYCPKKVCKKVGASLKFKKKNKELGLQAPNIYYGMCNRLRNAKKFDELKALQTEYKHTKKTYSNYSPKKLDEKLVNLLKSYQREYEKNNPHKYGRKPKNVK